MSRSNPVSPLPLLPHLTGADGLLLGRLSGTQTDAAGALSILPAGDRLVVGQADGLVRCVRLQDGAELWVAQELHEPVLQAVACSRDGRLVATSAEDGLVRLREAATGVQLAVWSEPSTVFDLRFSAQGTQLATAGADETVALWEVATGRLLVRGVGHEAWVVSVDGSPRSGRLASASNDSSIRLWDATNGAELLRRPTAMRPSCLRWSPEGDRLAFGEEDGSVTILEGLAHGGVAVERVRFQADSRGVNGLAWSPDGRLLAVAGDEGVHIVDADRGAERLHFPIEAPFAWRVDWSSTGSFVAASLHGDSFCIWDVRRALAA